MLDDIIEVILEFILDGMVAAAGSKKVPLPIRIILGVVLAAAVLGMFGLLFYVGIQSGSVLLIVLSLLLLIAAVIWVSAKVRSVRQRR